jgi:RHS repeat-associated protein
VAIMTKKLSVSLVVCALLLAPGRLAAQNGPDNDPDAAPGYTNSVFHHEEFDSVNLYNGQLTVPIALGPSYPIGPKLRFQLMLTYNSRVDDYGAPLAGQTPPPQTSFVYKPLAGNSSLGIGWELSLGAIKPCRHGLAQGQCYVGPDGSQHMFTRTQGSGKVTGDGTQYFLKGAGPYDMWDGDGNHYVFDKQATGFDDTAFEGFTHDFGRGRDGWYLGSITDPHGNGYSITYWTGGHPRWTYGASTCDAAYTGWMQMKAPAGTGGWIPKDITLPSGQIVRVNRGNNGHLDGMVVSAEFPVFVNDALTTRTWSLIYDTPQSFGHSCATGTVQVNLQRLKELKLPSDLTGSPKYQFVQSSLLTRLTLPTGGTIEYCYGGYTFFHGRAAAVVPNCPGLPPPSDAFTTVSANTVQCGGFEPEIPTAPDSTADCTEDNEARWVDSQLGVLKRTLTEPLRGRVSTTSYTQYSFPFGESGSPSAPGEPQTLTVVLLPPTDQNQSGSAGRRRARATLFQASPRITGAPPGTTRPSVPGDRVGADLEERFFEVDPNDVTPATPACPGTGSDAPFCASKSLRTLKRTFDYDDAVNLEGNRRVASERTIHGAGNCATCPYHLVALSNSSGDWESNGRHYENETHSGTLGGDSRTTYTDWAPSGWTSGPPAGGSALPNLFHERRMTQGTSTRQELFDFDTATGFLKGSIVYDALRGLAFLRCRYPDADGNTDKEFSKTFNASSPPARTYCSTNHPSFPSSVGLDGDSFGKDLTWLNGELVGARWVNGSVGTGTFPTRSYARDGTTGWVTTSSDTAGLATRYLYDALGRPTQVTPPGAGELKTFVCYEGPNATTAYRAAAAQACPVAPGNAQAKTWEHFDYDGLGRVARERKVVPGAGVSKRFQLFDAAGNGHFRSEWVADGTSEAVTADLPTACVFSGGNFATNRPSSAPGTYQLCFDPFGRPQQVVGSKHSSLQTVDRKDGTTWYSGTLDAALTYCVNGTFTNLQAAACSTGGLNSTTTSRKDAFGRMTSVTEPSGDVTTYVYDVNSKLTKVTQGSQIRTYGFDTAGMLRSETTPEGGAVAYEVIGSLGNVRQEKRPGNLTVTRSFDFAGRVTREDAGGAKYAVHCYDGADPCADGSPNLAGPNSAGKLTRRYGYNHLPTIGPIVDEAFEYAGPGGRMSRLTTAAGNGGLAASASQTWSYDSLGLPSGHAHPRVSGAPAFSASFGYTNGLPTTASAGGQAVVTAAAYGPSLALTSWTAGNSGTPVVTSVAPDASLLPRPANISNALWSSGLYTYDGAGDILKMGTSDSFTYDSRARLMSATFGSTPRGFAYDRWGNLTQNGSTAFTIDPATNRVTSGGVAYDPRGNIVARTGETMFYDLLDRQYRNATASADFVYLFTGAGERVAKFPSKSTVLRREMARYIAEGNVFAKGWSLPACTQVFTDVPCSDPDARHIKLAYEKGITGGCSASPLQYCPDATLTRAQMAVFLVKGYKTDGFTPPACAGTFQDVTCGGPYAAFAPWIEQLYRDGVTAGCSASPLQFCPGSTVGEWEMLVWLAKAPGASPASPFWAAYHPVPRGTIYTFRDDSHRIVTEMAGGTSGASTATLSVTQDNVFLGNLLIASYFASPPGWRYTVSDHLGTPRAVFNQSGQLVETRKHWPYGEDTTATPPTQRLAYALMERDSESTRFYDHARNHDHQLGRFLSPDRVGGTTANPQSWNRYAYTLNNPMKFVDPDGRLTIVVHGTWASSNPTFQPSGNFFKMVAGSIPDRAYASLTWSGGNSEEARTRAARAIASIVAHHKFAPGEQLNIVAHSHGNNVAITALNLGLARAVNNLVFLGAPARSDYQLEGRTPVGNFLAVSARFDPIQHLGGSFFNSPIWGEWGPAGHSMNGALNIAVETSLFDLFSAHERLHESRAVWKVVSWFLDISSQDFGKDREVYWLRD